MPGRRRHRRSDHWNEPDWIDVDDEFADDDELFDIDPPDAVPPRSPFLNPPPPSGGWQHQMTQIAATMRATAAEWPAGREINYVVSVPETVAGGALVSLKAGGLGLNLTAAEHIFLLDPWWNPATEAQAIDRAHRIGQSRHVLALRLIAHDTVEEKILALQAEKRGLADAIINEQNSLIRMLTREDLEQLLS